MDLWVAVVNEGRRRRGSVLLSLFMCAQENTHKSDGRAKFLDILFVQEVISAR